MQRAVALQCGKGCAGLGCTGGLALAVSVCWPGMAVRMVRQTACPLWLVMWLEIVCTVHFACRIWMNVAESFVCEGAVRAWLLLLKISRERIQERWTSLVGIKREKSTGRSSIKVKIRDGGALQGKVGIWILRRYIFNSHAKKEYLLPKDSQNKFTSDLVRRTATSCEKGYDSRQRHEHALAGFGWGRDPICR